LKLPRLVFLPAIALDQTFPRTADELDIARQTLAALNELSLDGSIVIGITDVLAEFVESFDGTTFANPDSRDTYNLLLQICTAAHHGVVRLSGDQDCDPHPIPAESEKGSGLVEIWADEMGQLVAVHRQCGENEVTCAGLASALAFSERGKTHYDPTDVEKLRFALVGPNEIETLLPCKELRIEANLGGRIVIGIDDVYTNYAAIGGSHIEEGGEHPAIHFPNGDKWPFDKKWGDYIRDRLLAELRPVTGLELDMIKLALKTGRRPVLRWKPCVESMI
jgi:hypothetical protein